MTDALEQWRVLVAYANGQAVTGLDGMRDPDSVCLMFVSGKPVGTCETDGHYLCRKCTHSVPHPRYTP